MTQSPKLLIESDSFPFEFLSQLSERESWRKEVHRPIYHIHKWWAKRLGTVFRGVILGSLLPKNADLEEGFYARHDFTGLKVLDPFMGSGTTIGEAHKLGLTALGRDINSVAVRTARVAFGPLDRSRIQRAFRELGEGVGQEICSCYQTKDSRGHAAEILYSFWVMQATCPDCRTLVDLFPSYVVGRNAYPDRKPAVQIVCPACGQFFLGNHRDQRATCPCGHCFDPESAPVRGAKAVCQKCTKQFQVVEAIGGKRPTFRLYGKLVLTKDQTKEYLRVSEQDDETYAACSRRLLQTSPNLPALKLEFGHNTRQAMRYGFVSWRDFFNDRQLLCLSLLRSEILRIDDEFARDALFTLFSGVLEFNNLFASYKGEGTGAVRHMFSHHILKPERTPLEANVWGTPKSSGSFSNLYRSRLLRALDYREAPTEVNGTGSAKGRVCSKPFSGTLGDWGDDLPARGVSVSCGDSAKLGLAEKSVDLVVTDPPFFDNVHYSELADFFHAWHQLGECSSTRSDLEVQDAAADKFAAKLTSVFRECHRVLKDEGLLVFSYHHSRDEGWDAIAQAVLAAGFVVVNSQPLKAEMSVATPKSQAKCPIQLDIVLVCRKYVPDRLAFSREQATTSAISKINRLKDAGFQLSVNDERIVFYGQLLSTLSCEKDAGNLSQCVEEQFLKRASSLASSEGITPLTAVTACRMADANRQKMLFANE